MIVELDKLRKFDIFKYFTEQQLRSALSTAKILKPAKMKVLAQKGFADKQHYYFLLAGEVLLDTGTGRGQALVKASSDRSAEPILSNTPSRYKLIAARDVELLQVEAATLEQNMRQNREEKYEIFEPISESEIEESHILYDLIVRLNKQDYVLPSLPAVALRITEKLQDHRATYQEIAEVVMMDAVITTKLMKVANSAYYGRGNPAKTLPMAISRIGLQTVMDLVCSYAIKELFKSDDPLVNIRMYQLWEHSIDIAVMSHVLAKHMSQVEAENAMLAGLIHDIGVNVILSLAQEYPVVTSSKKHLSQVVEHMRHEIGVTILRKWGFSDELINVAAGVQDWQRKGSEQPDYTDIVNMAHLIYRSEQSVQGKELMLSTPVYGKFLLDDEAVRARLDEALVMKSLLIG